MSHSEKTSWKYVCTKELHINYNDVKVLIVLTEGFPFFYVWAFHQLYSLVWHFSKIDKSRPCLILFVDLYLESSNNSMLLDRWPRISVQRTLKWYGYWTEFLFAIQSFILHWHAVNQALDMKKETSFLRIWLFWKDLTQSQICTRWITKIHFFMT